MATFTLSQYKTWVRARLDDTAYSDSNLTQFINDANRYICNAERWSFMEATQSPTIAQAGTTFSFAADYQAGISLRVVSPDASAGQLPFMPYEQFDLAYPDTSALSQTGPSVWTTFGGAAIVGPAPMDQTYTFAFRYLKSPTTLSGASDVVDIPDDFSEVLVLGTLARCLMANDNYDQAQIIQQEFAIQMQMMASRLLPSALTAPVTMGSGRL